MTCKTSVQLYVSTIIIVNNYYQVNFVGGRKLKVAKLGCPLLYYNKVVLSVGMAGEALECVCVCVCVKERGEGMAWEVQNSYY